jgi:ABC-type bacteriocin/lantibiotic exporter with double-glycine peptidase domain
MVLAALGEEFSEAQLATVMGSYEFGTPASRITRLCRLGYRVKMGPASLDELRWHLEHGRYPIVFVRADFLLWADFGGLHAMVVGGMTATHALILDPALESGPTPLPLDELLLAWGELDQLMAVVSRPSPG